MIFDNIKNIDKYKFEKNVLRALELEAKITADNYPEEKIILDNGDYLIPCKYDTQIKETPIFEAHREYVDVMYMVEGREVIKVINTDKLMNITAEYDTKKDALLAECKDGVTNICLNSGDFIILYPQDAHSPGCAEDDKELPVKKVIGKIKINK